MRPLIGITTSDSDSGTHIQLRMDYHQSVEDAGAQPVLLWRCGEAAAEGLAQRLDGLILAGGGDMDPARYGQTRHEKTELVSSGRDDTELWLTRAFLEAGKPVLGICRGIQTLNVALGGDSIQDLPQMRGVKHANVRHEITWPEESFLSAIFPYGKIEVNSFHHQAVGRLGAGLQCAARAADGTIEAVSDGGRNLFGVQWHPEKEGGAGQPMAPLFRYFVAQCIR